MAQPPRRVATAVAAALLAGAATSAAPRIARAQPQSVQVVPPPGGDTLRSITPRFTVQAVGAGLGPLRFRFELDSTGRFAPGALLLDTLVQTSDSVVSVRPTRPLQRGTRVFWRATVLGPSGAATVSPVGGPRITPPWVTPLRPTTGPGAVSFTQRPTFVWRSPTVEEPPGPWEYELVLSNQGNTRSVVVRDTVYTPGENEPLESSATWSWTITARLPRVGRSESASPGSFSVQDTTELPATTLLYQNFPNPFPSVERQATCIWVDIARPTRASLDVYTLRGMRVRRLLPRAELGELLAPRRYGRPPSGSTIGCDPAFEWDGRDDRGDYVPAGVYLMRFKAEGVESVKKIVYRGRG